MFESLKVIEYPDPILRKIAKPVEHFDERLKLLVARMFELMREHKGVGLAAPQVGISERIFVMNPTGNPEDDRAYINPKLFDVADREEGEEGCLSLPKLHAIVDRAKTVELTAQDVDGNPVQATETGYLARIWQHEFDHLNGVMIIDRMGDVAKMTHRKLLRELEAKYEAAHPKRKK